MEPFMLMDSNREVRCFEPDSGLNKTFKIVRMDDVEALSDNWAFKDRHKQMFTDAFMFSSEETTRVEMRLGQLSHDLMAEEFPRTLHNMTQEENGTWLLSLDICSYIGIGRFVLGLFDDIEVLGDEGFKRYLKEKLDKFNGILA